MKAELLLLTLLNAPGTLVSPIPTPRPNVGVYVATRGFFADTQLTTQIKNGELTVRSALHAKSDDTVYGFPFEIPIQSAHDNVLKGQGNFSIEFNSGAHCDYPLTIEVVSFADRVFVRHQGPQNFPIELNGKMCELISESEYRWVTHPDPYILQEAR